MDPQASGSAPTSCRRRSSSLGEELAGADQGARPSGEHTDEVLRDVLGYDDERIAALRAAGALG